MNLTITPVGTATTSLVACMTEINNWLVQEDCVRKKQVSSRVTPLGFLLEGPLEEIWPLARRLHEVPFGGGAGRVVTTLQLDDCRHQAETGTHTVREILKQTRAG